MLLFLFGTVMLIVGYYTYGKFVEHILAPDDRATPAQSSYDGVDYVKLPHWKNMLIQLLNIAGVGPVIGVILGIKFGSIVFLIIPLGNVIGGAVHDFISGMMSLRNNGANLPKIVKINLGSVYYKIFSWFMVLLLLLVVAVFVNVPANLIDSLMPSANIFWVAVVIIFVYYIFATLFPIDKIIGKIYPIFGAMLLIGTLAIFVALIWNGSKDPATFMVETEAFKAGMITQPIIPCLFVTIACGIMSGFHATQSPIIARTMESERQARSSFYGMMIVEGVIAMIWAAAGMAIYNLFPEMMKSNPTAVLSEIAKYFLGGGLGVVAIVSVIILSITSGDTAMRSLRLSLSEMLGINQKALYKRFILCLPIIAVVGVLLWWSNLSAATFGKLWNYFAWGNQVLAASTLMAGTAWLISLKKQWFIAAVPGMFMTFVVVSFILWSSPKHGGPVGFGLDINISYAIAAVVTLLMLFWAYRQGKKAMKNNDGK